MSTAASETETEPIGAKPAPRGSAIAARGERRWRVGAFDAKVVDTTGAGDAMASGTGIVQAGVDNTLLGVIFRALWAIVGGHRSELAQDAPDACARSVADSTYAGPWDLCHKYYSVVLLWALLNVLFIVVLGVWMARRGIMIKL